MRRKLVILMAGFLLAAFVAGCGGKPTAAACGKQTDGVVICLNGKPIHFEKGNGPHGHESGNIYAPAIMLAKAMKVDLRMVISADGQTAIVTVNGKPFKPSMAAGAKGIHLHKGEVFVPVKEFAEAAGVKLEMNPKEGWVRLSQ